MDHAVYVPQFAKYGILVNYTCQSNPNKVNDVTVLGGWTWKREGRWDFHRFVFLWRVLSSSVRAKVNLEFSYELHWWTVTLDSSVCKISGLISFRILCEQLLRWVEFLLGYHLYYLLNFDNVATAISTTAIAGFSSSLGGSHSVWRTVANVTSVLWCA